MGQTDSHKGRKDGATPDAGGRYQESLERVLKQISRIDRARSQEEGNAGIWDLLKEIGIYTDSERAYIFETKENPDIFTNTFEWCAPGVTPQIDNLQTLGIEEMPIWYQMFSRRQNIVIDDLEEIRESMPLEYEILKLQDIHAEISFPIWHKDSLIGFIGLDNPQFERSELFISLLSVVGGHLGEIWDNWRMSAMLRENDELLQQSRHELNKAVAEARLNNEILSAISKTYVSIYRIDLIRDFYEEVSNEGEVHTLTGKSGRASVKMLELCDTFVEGAYYDRVRQFFDLSTLAERLAEEESIAEEFLSKNGNWQMTRFIVKKRDEQGRATRVLYVTRLINDTKRREQNWIAIAEEANRANAAKTEFLSRMSHDIRTPMNALRGYTKIAKANLDDLEKVKEGLEKIDLAGRYLEQLVNDVLDLTRIENGQIRIHAEPVSITELYHEFESFPESTTEGKRLTFEPKFSNLLCDRVMTDGLRLKQICANLLSNAVKYTPDGGRIVFEILEEATEDQNVRLTFVVSDTGIGMTPEFMERMYASFSREVDTRVNQVRGSGLGLAIVRQLVDLMDGELQVKSKPGEGTVFRVSFLVERAPLENGKQAQEKADPVQLCRGMRLLVAEDNDLNYEVVCELLSEYDITCSRAMDGAMCVEMFQNAPAGTYDAILMDMMMPVMDGVTAASAIRNLNHPDARKIPIIALTANAYTFDIQNCLDAGMNDHLSKPFDVQKLLGVLAGYR